MEYLLCQYHFLHYELFRHQSPINAIPNLLELDFFIYPLSFSLPCTVALVDYFYSQRDYPQCLHLIDQLIQFWWSFLHPREKLELAKLKSLSLIIELKQGAMESAILSGYFAKRILTGYNEHVFLIETCIHLTLALIGEMRLANIEPILQHLEYLTDQTLNVHGKLWYYILIIDVAMELGYEICPIRQESLEQILKYRKRLRSGPNQRSLTLFYSDCTLAQIYGRMGLLETSKIHFHSVLHQFECDQMYLSKNDFRLQRALLKLVEVQLIHWYHGKEEERDENWRKDCFLFNALTDLKSEECHSWNHSRYGIYQAYYDRLINAYRREKGDPIDVSRLSSENFRHHRHLLCRMIRLGKIFLKKSRAMPSN